MSTNTLAYPCRRGGVLPVSYHHFQGRAHGRDLLRVLRGQTTVRRLLALFRRPERRPERHRHQWTYTGPHGTGWLIARCECGAWDLAS